MSTLESGECQHCRSRFGYAIYHCGFGDSAYGYCDRCGRTALLSTWSPLIPHGVSLTVHEPIRPDIEALLAPCNCSGKFRGDAKPRCTHCRHELDAHAATRYIEANAPGTAKGWRWQGNWSGIYCIDVEGRAVHDNWETGASAAFVLDPR